jgi:hypothetical protein
MAHLPDAELYPTMVSPKLVGHVRGDVACVLPVKLVCGRELQTALHEIRKSELRPSIGAGQRSLQARVQKSGGLNHGHADSAAISMAIGQPEEIGRLRSFGRSGVSTARYIPKSEAARPLAADNPVCHLPKKPFSVNECR